jgi:hypothetical protein
VFQSADVPVRLPPDGPGGMSRPMAQALALGELRDEERVQVVLLYLGVAASRVRPFDSKEAAALGQLLKDGRAIRELSQAFSRDEFVRFSREPVNPRTVSSLVNRVDVFGLRLAVSPGCAVVATGNGWYMYKAAWAAARVLPRCGEG